MVCPKCNAANLDNAHFCKECGENFYIEAQQTPPPMEQPYYPEQTYYQSSGYSAPAYPQYQMTPPEKKSYTWHDICTIVGFCAALVGFGWFWPVLCPVGAISSFLGYKGDKTKGLAVAGIIISILGILIKIGDLAYRYNWFPDWLTKGVFF